MMSQIDTPAEPNQEEPGSRRQALEDYRSRHDLGFGAYGIGGIALLIVAAGYTVPSSALSILAYLAGFALLGLSCRHYALRQGQSPQWAWLPILGFAIVAGRADLVEERLAKLEPAKPAPPSSQPTTGKFVEVWILPALAAAYLLFGPVLEDFPYRRVVATFSVVSIWALVIAIRQSIALIGAKKKPTRAVAAVIWSGFWTLVAVAKLISDYRRPATTVQERTIASAEFQGTLPSGWRVFKNATNRETQVTAENSGAGTSITAWSVAKPQPGLVDFETLASFATSTLVARKQQEVEAKWDDRQVRYLGSTLRLQYTLRSLSLAGVGRTSYYVFWQSSGKYFVIVGAAPTATWDKANSDLQTALDTIGSNPN